MRVVRLAPFLPPAVPLPRFGAPPPSFPITRPADLPKEPRAVQATPTPGPAPPIRGSPVPREGPRMPRSLLCRNCIRTFRPPASRSIYSRSGSFSPTHLARGISSSRLIPAPPPCPPHFATVPRLGPPSLSSTRTHPARHASRPSPPRLSGAAPHPARAPRLPVSRQSIRGSAYAVLHPRAHGGSRQRTSSMKLSSRSASSSASV